MRNVSRENTLGSVETILPAQVVVDAPFSITWRIKPFFQSKMHPLQGKKGVFLLYILANILLLYIFIENYLM
jgi:hypothetical protein